MDCVNQGIPGTLKHLTYLDEFSPVLDTGAEG